ncbi:MAG: hypothetical protein AB7T20_10740 [Steroidobacteraceae bacterium]
MKITLRMVAAIAVGTMILVSAAADAGTRTDISPDAAKRLRYQAQQYHQMQRHPPGPSRPGVLAQRSWIFAFARRMLPRTSAAALLPP